MTYYIGDLIRISAVFTNESDVEADPSTVTVKYKDPSSVESSKVYGVDGEVIKDSTGNYHIDIDMDEGGFWYYRWEGTGAVVAAEEASLEVEKSAFS